MITLIHSEEEDTYGDTYHPASTLEVEIDNQDMTWGALMKIFARQLPKMGYILDVMDLEDAIDDAVNVTRAKVIDDKGVWHRGDYE